jgi:hypothetical protein
VITTVTNKIEVICEVLEGSEAGQPLIITLCEKKDKGPLYVYAVGSVWSRENDKRCSKFKVLRHRPQLF